VAVGTITNGRLHVEIVHRFPNGPVERNGGLYWPHEQIWDETCAGLAKVGPYDSVGVDSWGVDYVLLDSHGQVLDGMRHYRDPRNDGIMQQLVAEQGDRIYGQTGIQFLPFNTLFQLRADNVDRPEALAGAKNLLMVPDYFHWKLSGELSNELTDASTTQMLDPRSRRWSGEMLDQAGVLASLLRTLSSAGDQLGKVQQGLPGAGARVILPGTHDTASAVAAVPAEGDDWAYVSSGTWSLVGVELPEPIINDAARQGGFTNEIGIKKTIRFLKNMTGLWILQECRRAWGNPDYADLYGAAAKVEDAPSFDPDDPCFMATGDDMPERVMRCAGSQNDDQAFVTRAIFNSLAAKTAEILDQLETITGRKIERVHVVGGGSQIDLLNQLIADASGRQVIAGPTEATLIGNILVQAEACGSIPAGSIRETVKRSFETKTYKPA